MLSIELKCIFTFQVVAVSYSCNGMMLKKFNNGRTSNSLFNEDFEDYYDYEEPLPQGPTRPPPSSSSKKVTFPQEDDYPEEDYYDYYQEEELPRGPTREPPLPSGPTRRPGQVIYSLLIGQYFLILSSHWSILIILSSHLSILLILSSHWS